MLIDVDEWNYLDDSSDDGWIEENDDFTSELEKKEKEIIDSFQDLVGESDSPKKGSTLQNLCRIIWVRIKIRLPN